ncbi:MAG: ATP-binding protein, partial [Pseudomonadota bacterium]
SEYVQLERRRAGVQVAFGLMYLMIAMTLLLAAVWTGLSFANRLIVPIRQLIGAAERVSAGDLNAQVDTAHADGDLKQLSETFNNMTSELSTQHGQLLSTNAELAERRQFIEAVLAGVSAGVIHLNADGRVTLINRSAARHLPALAQMPEGAQLTEIRPEFAGVLDQLKRGQARALTPGATDDPAVSLGKAASLTAEHALQAQAQVTIDRGETKQTFAVIASREWTGEEPAGTIVTFDDISDLVAAERIAAWADFARRVAHEIKNPLTPIQLSAQRLRRKYADEITSDPQTFEKCTTTIVQKVEEMKRMLNNFSAQGKMPDAVLVQDDLVDVVRDTLFLQSNAHSEISFTVELHSVDDAPVDIPMIGAEPQTGGPEQEIDLAAAAVAKHTSQVPRIVIDLDRSQLGQSLINLVKNGIEAIAAVHEAGNAPDGYRGAIRIEIHDDGPELTVAVIDNGCGLPKHDRAALVDPYVTHREKGTGLGLNIVMRTAEQHGGRLELTDAPYPVHGQLGAAIRIILPRDGKARLMQANTASDHSTNEQAANQTAAQNSGTGNNLHVAAE